MSTTGPKKCGTTDREIPTSKTENIMRTSCMSVLSINYILQFGFHMPDYPKTIYMNCSCIRAMS